MADDTPLANEPRGNKNIIMILIAAGVIFLIIFIMFFSGVFRENIENRGNSNAPSSNQGRAVP